MKQNLSNERRSKMKNDTKNVLRIKPFIFLYLCAIKNVSMYFYNKKRIGCG